MVDFEESRLASLMCVDLIQIVEGLSIIKADLPEQEGILPAYCLVFFPGSLACPVDFGLTSPLQSHKHTHTHTHTYTLLDLFLWITLANTKVFLTTKLYTEIAQSELLNHRG